MPLFTALLVLSACFSQQKSFADAQHQYTDTGVRQTSQETQKSLKESVKIESMAAIAEIPWTYFSGKYDVDIHLGEGQDYNGTLSFRMKRDSVFWFSVSASIGFQIAKGIIINDTLHALDQLQKNYYRVPLKALQASTQLPASIGALQRLFSGEVLTTALTYAEETQTWNGDTTFYPGYKARINPEGYVSQNAINDDVYKRYLTSDYSGRTSQGIQGYAVAPSWTLTLKDALNTIRLDVQLKTASFEPIPSYPFYVPNGYTLVESW